jgi:cellulose synthase operon protein C
VGGPSTIRSLASPPAADPWDPSLGTTSPLRLTAAQGGLGIEAYRPLTLGPLSVHELAWSLPGVRFPVDLSGGVRSFHNRRGRLTSLRVEVELEAVARWLHPRVKHLLGGCLESPTLWPVDSGVGVGLWCRQGAVAFDLLWAPDGGDARFVVHNPRGAGFEGPALGSVLAVVDAAFGKFGKRQGRVILVERAVERLVWAVLPELGVRAPALSEVAFGELSFRGSNPAVEVRAHSAPDLPPVTGRALGLAELLKTGDERLLAADPEGAREAYVAALERAPRHPEICQLVVSLDSAFSDRTEAALGLLVESLPVTAFGLLGAELLLRNGETAGAELAIQKQVQLEPFPPLAALIYERVASLSDNVAARLDYLDRALAIVPRSNTARWARLEARLAVSDANGALADAEHLEAATRGSRERYDVLLAAAERLRDTGFLRPAGRLFERALRYLPKGERAALGLAESLIESGNERRAFPLLERAVEADDEATRSRAFLVRARLLASVYRDLPQAIASAQQVTAIRPNDALAARGLEARWRDQLGDLAGARLAFARLHDLAAAHRELEPRTAVDHLLAASRFASETAHDLHAAHRHAALALRVNPKDARVQARYREVSNLLGTGKAPAEAPPDAPPSAAESGPGDDPASGSG